MADVRRVLLVRLDGIGDALVCVPALEALRAALPGAEFGAVCSPRNAALFSRSRVANVHVLAGEDRGAVAALAAELRSRAYTDALVATEETAGYTLAARSGARRRVGFWHRFEKPFKSVWQFAHLTAAVYRPAAWVGEPEHEVNEMHGLALRLGASPTPSTDACALRLWLDVDAAPPHDTAGALALQIASKWFARGWDARAVAAMAVAALETSPLRRCVLLAAPDDAGHAQAVMEAVPAGLRENGAIRFAASGALRRWLGAIASASALLTPDTGAAHAAGMLGVPVVDVFEEERFAQLSRRWRPWAAPSRCIARPDRAGESSARDFGVVAGHALADLLASAGVVS
jgi:ADP-heptose:LPS heptosyltransferase